MKPRRGRGAHPAVSAPESDAAGALTGQASRTCGVAHSSKGNFYKCVGLGNHCPCKMRGFPAPEAPGAPALPGRRSGILARVSAEQCSGTGPWHRRVVRSSVCPPSQNASSPPEAPTVSPVPWLSQSDAGTRGTRTSVYLPSCVSGCAFQSCSLSSFIKPASPCRKRPKCEPVGGGESMDKQVMLITATAGAGGRFEFPHKRSPQTY